MQIRAFLQKYWRDLLILIPVLSLASWLRLNDIRGYMVFLGDQGRDALVVKRMIVDLDPTFIGPNASVGGFYLGPLYYYMMAPAMLLSNLDPVGPAIMVAVFSVLTTLLVYYYLKRYVCLAAALIGSSLYAVSALIVEYARFSWNPNVLPFFSMLLLLIWTKVLTRDTRRLGMHFFGIGLLLGSVVQLHYAALSMIIYSILVYLFYLVFQTIQGHRLRLVAIMREVGLVLGGFLLILLPFIGFEIKNGYPNFCGVYNATIQNVVNLPNSIQDYCFATYPILSQAGESIFVQDGSPFEFIVRDVSERLFLRLVAGGDERLLPIIYAIIALATLYGLYRFLVLLIIYVRNTEKQSTARKYLQGFISESSYQNYAVLLLLFFSWWVVGVGWWGFYKKSIHDYYFSYMYPLPILVFAIACALLIHMYSRRMLSANPLIRIGKLLVWAFVIILISTNLFKLSTVFPGQQVYRSAWAADGIYKMLGDGEYNFALISEGNSDHAYRFFLEIKDRERRLFEIKDRVAPQLIVLCEVEQGQICEPEGNSLWEVAGYGPAKIVGQSTVIGYPLYRLQHVEGEQWRIGQPAKKGD